MMSNRTVNKILKLAIVICGLTTVGVLAGCLLWPCAVIGSTEAPDVKTSTIASTAKPSRPTKKEFAGVWNTPLRRPLVDPASTKNIVAVAVAPRPPLNLQLIGVALESQHSLAMFSSLRGGIEVKGVGETVGDDNSGIKVINIDAQGVEILYLGQKVTLGLEEVRKR